SLYATHQYRAKGTHMSEVSDDTIATKVQIGMRIISADGVSIGKVWQVHFRDTETYIEVRPRTFWNTLLEFSYRPQLSKLGDLFVPADSIARIEGKRVHMQLDAEAVKACVSRPPWIEHEKMPTDSVE